MTALTVLLVAVLVTLGVAKLLALPPMRAAAAHVGFGVGAYRVIGALEVAGAVGLVAGHRWSLLGAAAASGVALLMAGGVVAHARAGDPPARWIPAIAVGLVAVGYAVAVTT